MAKTTVFFRDDDVGGLTDPLRALVELLLEEGVPCNYLVVPAHLDGEAADYMRGKRRDTPDLVRLNQHGYEHQHRVGGEMTYAEYSGGRSQEDQFASLAEGRRILEEMLGAEFDPRVFTPPCHKYDENTVRALDALGFSVLSAGVKGSLGARLYYGLGRAQGRIHWLGKRVSYHCGPIPATGLVEVSGSIDVDEDVDREGNKIVKSAADLTREFQARRREPSGITGFMLHHANYLDDSKLDTLREVIGMLRDDPTVEFSLIESVADRVTPTLNERRTELSS